MLHGIPNHAYQEDLLVMAMSLEDVQMAVNAIVHVFLRAGFILNLKKLNPVPNTRHSIYLKARSWTGSPFSHQEVNFMVVLRSFL
jgi:hypothetical protein